MCTRCALSTATGFSLFLPRVCFIFLYTRLDALSNLHFTPKPLGADEDNPIKPNVTTLALEEVLPFHAGARAPTAHLAPEEVYQPKKGRDRVVRGETERTREELGAARRAKKAARRKKRRRAAADARTVDRLNPGMGNKHAKAKLSAKLANERNVSEGAATANDGRGGGAANEYTSSSKFFQKLQEEARIAVGDMRAAMGGKKKGKGGGSRSAALKL